MQRTGVRPSLLNLPAIAPSKSKIDGKPENHCITARRGVPIAVAVSRYYTKLPEAFLP